VRRAWLLEQLSRHDWSLERTATALRADSKELVRRLANAGLGYLLKPHVLTAR
jgi:DNA-binding NtrC family response regulator